MSRWDEAEGHFERALEMNAKMETPLWVAHAQHDYARMLIRRGDATAAKRARELLQAARSAYKELRMTTWAQSAAGDLDQLS
jgi:hypothetical protein